MKRTKNGYLRRCIGAFGDNRCIEFAELAVYLEGENNNPHPTCKFCAMEWLKDGISIEDKKPIEEVEMEAMDDKSKKEWVEDIEDKRLLD